MQERGHLSRGHPEHVATQALQLLHCQTLTVPLQLRAEAPPSLRPSPSQSSRSPELPWRALALLESQIISDTEADQCQRLCLCGSEAGHRDDISSVLGASDSQAAQFMSAAQPGVCV